MKTAFQIDTSGVVAKPGESSPAPNGRDAHCTMCGRDNRGYEGDPCSDDCPSRSWAWEDLSPFTQGYIEALFEAESYGLQYPDTGPGFGGVEPGFSDLAPETLARIIADCEAFAPGPHPDLSPAAYGREFWHGRANGFAAWSVDRADYARRFPPLTATLGDDGKVRLADAGGNA